MAMGRVGAVGRVVVAVCVWACVARYGSAQMPDLNACGDTCSGMCCTKGLDITINPPLGSGTYYDTHCSGSQPCIPVDYPIGNWIRAFVTNSGTVDSPAFRVGLYVSERVSADGTTCALNEFNPTWSAIELATISYPEIATGATLPIAFPVDTHIEYWMASQLRHGRFNMLRCLFIMVDDLSAVTEEQRTEVSNVASTVVKLLDLVELEPTSFDVSFNLAPWMRGVITNKGVVTAPTFRVDFYGTVVGDASQDCPARTNLEFPLSFPKVRQITPVYLGSNTVEGLLPDTPRFVYPRVTRVPSTTPNVSYTCFLMFIDSQHNVPEPFDGPDNVVGQRAEMAVVRNFVGTPVIVRDDKEWDRVIVIYVIGGLIFATFIGYWVYKWCATRKRFLMWTRGYTERQAMKKEVVPVPEEQPFPIWREEPEGKIDPDLEKLEEEDAKFNPDLNKPIRVGPSAAKSGIVRDKKGKIIGSIDRKGVIRDREGRRVGVSSYAESPDKRGKKELKMKKAKTYAGYFT